MKNKAFTLVEIMVVTAIGMGVAAVIFSIFVVMNNGFVKTNAYANLRQQAQIAINATQNYLEKAIPETITIAACNPKECLGDKITFQVPVVTDDAVAGTVFTNLGELKRGAYYSAAGQGTIMVRNAYLDIYASYPDQKLVAVVWQQSTGSGGGGSTCFLAGTPVVMADGSTKSIEQVKPGDKVLAFNEKSGKIQKDKVAKLLVHKAKKYLIINGRIKVTPEHRFFHEGKWANIGSLKVGDKLLNYKNQTEEIKSIEKVNQLVTVYNLTVKPSHTYFADGILVHNMKNFERDRGPVPGGGDEGDGPGDGPFGKLFNDIFDIKEAYAAIVHKILNTKIIATNVMQANFTTNAEKNLITIKLILEDKRGLAQETLYYEAQSEIAPLN